MMVSRAIILCSLLWATVSAQFSRTGICSAWTNGAAQCYDNRAGQGCPAGTSPHPTLAGTPWACGGWYKECCVGGSEPVPPINDSNCGLGTPTNRILNGSSTSRCSWPYIASVRLKPFTDQFEPLTQTNTQHGCAAVFIDKYWALTHPICCLFEQEPVVVAGEFDTSVIDDDPAYPGFQQMEQFIPVKNCKLNPAYAKVTRASDLNLSDNNMVNGNSVALLQLAQPLNNHCASPACLPFATPLKKESCNAFEQCVVLGWGYNTENFGRTDNQLKQAYVKIYKNDVCDFLQNNLFNKTSDTARPANSSCQTTVSGQDVCLGDQGGPVLCYDGDRWSVQGIIPFNLCKNGKVNPYVADVTSHKEWIYDTIRKNPNPQ